MIDLPSFDNLDGEILAFDLGSKRIGVARVNTNAKLPEALEPIVIENDGLSAVIDVIKEVEPVAVVFGLPRGLDGQETTQTESVRNFVKKLKENNGLSQPVFFIDEAGTSKLADQILLDRSGSRDSIAATIMLDDFLDYDNKQDLLA
jgi:putative transcription antitermination factor YqgF